MMSSALDLNILSLFPFSKSSEAGSMQGAGLGCKKPNKVLVLRPDDFNLSGHHNHDNSDYPVDEFKEEDQAEIVKTLDLGPWTSRRRRQAGNSTELEYPGECPCGDWDEIKETSGDQNRPWMVHFKIRLPSRAKIECSGSLVSRNSRGKCTNSLCCRFTVTGS